MIVNKHDSVIRVDADDTIVSFHQDGAVEVDSFGLLKQDYPCAAWVERLQAFRAWSRTQYVGDYDDYQIRDIVKKAADAAGVSVPESAWYQGDTAK